MNSQIIEPNLDFDFNKLSLSQPNGLQGGSYFTKILLNNEPFYIQSPKCITKQGIVNSNKKIYCDLIYNQSDQVFIEWIEKLEEKCQELIFQKKDYWFHNDFDMNDIESAFASPIKTYKSGRQYLMRTNLQVSKQINYNVLCNVYDEDENLLQLNSITNEVDIIPLIHVNGIKFSSKNFIFDLIVKQFMILKNEKKLDSCLIIKKTNIKENNDNLEKSINQEHVEERLEEPIKEESSNKEEKPVEEKESNEKEEPVEEKDSNEEEEQVQDESNNEEEPNNEEEKPVEEKDSNKEEKIDEKEPLDKESNNEDKSLEDVEKKDLEEKEDVIEENTDKQIVDLESLENIEVDDKNNLDSLEEVTLNIENDDSIKLNKREDLYYKLYKSAKEKAKIVRRQAINAYLEAKSIKDKYLLNDLETSSSEEEISDFEEDDEY